MATQRAVVVAIECARLPEAANSALAAAGVRWNAASGTPQKYRQCGRDYLVVGSIEVVGGEILITPGVGITGAQRETLRGAAELAWMTPPTEMEGWSYDAETASWRCWIADPIVVGTRSDLRRRPAQP